MIFTRQQYLNGEISHDDYYKQFVNKRIIGIVKDRIGIKTIIDSKDEHFNDIPLIEWDMLESSIHSNIVDSLFKLTKETRTLAVAVCIAKAAAKIVKNKG